MVAALFAGTYFADKNNPIECGAIPVEVPESEYNPIFYPADYSTSIVNEPQYTTQKALTFDYMGFNRAPSSYRGDSVKVAVIDSGLNYTHEDFGTINGVSGAIDNKSGQWLYYKYNLGYQTRLNDTLGHGTNVASVIASQINQLGCAGIAPNVDLYIFKVTNDNNGYEWKAINSALQYCIDNDVDVINMSFQAYEHAVSYGSSSMPASTNCSTQLTSALNSCHNAGITLVGAAGNYNTNEPSYPASNNHVISVGSLAENSTTSKAGFSNTYGIDLVAPGYVYIADKGTNSSYKKTSGTSFSAPIVTAAIALYKQKNPNATPTDIEAALYASCDKISGNPSWAGNGRLNVDKFLGLDSNTPSSISITNVPNKTLELEVGETFQIEHSVTPFTFDGGVQYSTNSTGLVSVSNSGLITALAEGEETVTISCINHSNITDAITISVKAKESENSMPTSPIQLDTVDLLTAPSGDLWLTNNLSSYCGSATANKYGNFSVKYLLTEDFKGLDFSKIESSSLTVVVGGGSNDGAGNISVSLSNGSSSSQEFPSNSNANTLKSNGNYQKTFVFTNETEFNSIEISAGAKFYLIDFSYTFEFTLKESDIPIKPLTGYYEPITATSGQGLLGQLHTLMFNTHTWYSSYDDCRDFNGAYTAMEPGTQEGTLTDFYTQHDISKEWMGGGDFTGHWNREHVWCQSHSAGLWNNTEGSTRGGGADYHHVRPLEMNLNSTRNNNEYGEVAHHNSTTEKYSKLPNGSVGYLGGYLENGTFEPLDSVKGDVARILMYVYTHYSTGAGGTTPLNYEKYVGDLKFNEIICYGTSVDASINMLLKWHHNDPVSDAEKVRNEAAYGFQGNRNPFIDHPEFADAIWGASTADKILDSIEVKTPKTSYIRGEEFVKPSVMATYKDGTSVEVKAAATFTGYNTGVPGEQTITVKYVEAGIEKETSYKITISLPETSKVTITRSSIGSMTSGYNWYNFDGDGIKGEAYASPSNYGIQINGYSNPGKGLFTSTNYGYVKTIKITKYSGATDREVTIYGSNTAYTEETCFSGTSIGKKTITSSGATWTLDDNFKYISLVSSNSTIIESLEITYGLTAITPEVTNISLDKTSHNIDLKDSTSFTLTPTVESKANPDTTVTWTSNNINVATVSKAMATKDEQITVSVLRTGTAVITATCGTKNAKCTVTVTDSRTIITGVTVTPSMLSLKKGESSALTAALTGSNLPSVPVYVWNTENSSVATVDQSGNVTAVAEGTTRISATYEGKTEYCSVTVTASITPGPGPVTTGYTLVTDASELAEGDNILIIGIHNDSYYSLAPYVSGNNCKTNQVDSPNNNVIGSEVADLTLGGSSGAWTLFDGTNYLYAAGGTGNNYLKGQSTAPGDTGKWNISIDDDGKASIVCVDTKTSKNTIRFNSTSGSYLFACYGSGQNDVYIYKKSSGSIAPQGTLTSITYSGITTLNINDTLENYTVTASYSDGSLKDVTSRANLSTIDTSTAGLKTLDISFGGLTISQSILVLSSDGNISGSYYEKVTSTKDLTNGKYLIVYEDGGVAFNGTLSSLDAASNTISVSIDNGRIESTETINAAAFTFDSSNGSFLGNGKKYFGNGTNSNAMTSSDSALGNTVSIDTEGNFVCVSSGGAYLRYNATDGQMRFRYYKSSSYTGQKAIQIFKLVESSSFAPLDLAKSFAFTFLSSFTCDGNGINSPTFAKAWSTLVEEYNNLSNEAKSLLGNASYILSGSEVTAENGTDETIAFAIARYDYVVGKYGYDNFINRNVPTVRNNQSNVFNAFTEIEGKSENILIVALSLAGLVSFGGYMVVKKRKEI